MPYNGSQEARNNLGGLLHGRVAELADAWDLKSQAPLGACGFKSRLGYLGEVLQQMGVSPVRWRCGGMKRLLDDKEDPERQLRPGQFTLRSLFLLTTLVAVVCGLAAASWW